MQRLHLCSKASYGIAPHRGAVCLFLCTCCLHHYGHSLRATAHPRNERDEATAADLTCPAIRCASPCCRPGASEADLDAAEAGLGVSLPPAFRALYRVHDGQARLMSIVGRSGFQISRSS